MPVGLRHLGRSAIQPPASFAKLESPSETPSITPNAYAGPPRLARNAGRIAVAASWPQSENRLARPIPSTPRVSQCFEDEDGLALECSFMLVKELASSPLAEMRCWRRFDKRQGRAHDSMGPISAITGVKPDYWCGQVVEGWRSAQFDQQVVDTQLECAVFGTKAIARDSSFNRRHADENRVAPHPPGQPCFEMRLAAEFVDKVAIVIEHGAVGDHQRRTERGLKLRGDLRMQNPKLPAHGCFQVYRKRRLARDFGNQLHIVVGFLQQRAHFVHERRLANAMRADQCEFQIAAFLSAILF